MIGNWFRYADASESQLVRQHAARSPDGSEPSGPAVRREWDWASALVDNSPGRNAGSNGRRRGGRCRGHRRHRATGLRKVRRTGRVRSVSARVAPRRTANRYIAHVRGGGAPTRGRGHPVLVALKEATTHRGSDEDAVRNPGAVRARTGRRRRPPPGWRRLCRLCRLLTLQSRNSAASTTRTCHLLAVSTAEHHPRTQRLCWVDQNHKHREEKRR